MRGLSALLPCFRCAAAAAWLLLGAGLACAGLFPCPDCSRQISSRAVLCPNCGCPGEAIAAAVLTAQTNAPPARPAFYDSLVTVHSDQAQGWGVAVSEGAAVQSIACLPVFR